MRSVLLVIMLPIIGWSPASGVHSDKLDDACRALGGVSSTWDDETATHAECRDGLSITLYKHDATAAAEGPAV